MRRKHLLVGAMVAGLFLTGTGTAQAWDLIHSRSGYDRVTVRAWTRDYNQVAFVADHVGTRIDVSIKVVCANGDTYENTWSDAGSRFRFVLGGLGNSRRCDHTFKVDGRNPSAELTLALFARG